MTDKLQRKLQLEQAPILPKDFDGSKFAAKYNLDPITDFWVHRKKLICPSLPNLTEADLSDCVLDPKKTVKATAVEAMEELQKSDNLEIQNLIVYITELEKKITKLEVEKIK